MALLEIGPLPQTQRATGRKPGIWRGHEEDAQQLRTLAQRHPGQWGKVLEGATSARAQQIASAIKKGRAYDFKPDETGKFVAHARKSAVTLDSGKTAYDVWARFVPAGQEEQEDESEDAAQEAKAS